jgi:hypothetical protein
MFIFFYVSMNNRRSFVVRLPNQNIPTMKLNTPFLLAAASCLPLGAWAAGGATAQLQIIHNCADLAAATVDVYVNGALLLDDFAFRTATPFVEVPAGVALDVAIAPGTSTSAADAIFDQSFTLAAGETYIVVASGTVSPSGYTPAMPFSLAVYDMAEETAAMGNTDVLVYHGCTDAPTVDVYESAVLNTTAVDNISYGDFAGYLNLPTADYTLQVRDAANSTIVAAYSAPLSTLGLDGAVITVLASGFLNPAVNSNGPAFGLYVALPTGGPLVPLPSVAIPTARVQVVHNCADLAAATVDVWLNNTLLLDDFAFRTASPFVDVQAGVPFVVSIAAPNSTDTLGSIAHYTYSLEEGGSYILVANGIVSTSGYSPVKPFDLYATDGAREVATDPMQTDILVFHGATDAPTVDVAETAVLGGATLVDNLSYGEFAGYLEVPTANYMLEVRTADGQPVASFAAPLADLGLQGQAITVFASGFLDPSMNSNGPEFGLWASLASGGPLVPLSNSTGIHENGLDAASMQLYPNPAAVQVNLKMSGAKDLAVDLRIADATGRIVLDLGRQQLHQGELSAPIDVHTLSSGLYRLVVQQGDAATSLPLQVVR